MSSSYYDDLVDDIKRRIDTRDKSASQEVSRGQRPLKMPKNYDFSVRNVDWNQYKNDFLLRTDAVWERSKLLDIFYVHYKSPLMYDLINNRYMVSDLRIIPLPTNEPEHMEDFVPFMGYDDIDGCVWQFRVGPKVQQPTTLSHFVSDREGDSWYLCFLTFQKFMLCNERSPVKLDEANLYNKGFFSYPCFDEVEHMLDICGHDLFEPLFEIYRTRLMSGTLKPQKYSRLQTHVDAYGTTSDRKVLHF